MAPYSKPAMPSRPVDSTTIAIRTSIREAPRWWRGDNPAGDRHVHRMRPIENQKASSNIPQTEMQAPTPPPSWGGVGACPITRPSVGFRTVVDQLAPRHAARTLEGRTAAEAGAILRLGLSGALPHQDLGVALVVAHHGKADDQGFVAVLFAVRLAA